MSNLEANANLSSNAQGFSHSEYKRELVPGGFTDVYRTESKTPTAGGEIISSYTKTVTTTSSVAPGLGLLHSTAIPSNIGQISTPPVSAGTFGGSAFGQTTSALPQTNFGSGSLNPTSQTFGNQFGTQNNANLTSTVRTPTTGYGQNLSSTGTSQNTYSSQTNITKTQTSQYGQPSTGFIQPPSITPVPSTGFNPPPTIYTPPSAGFNPPPAVYTPPSTGFNPPPSVYTPPSTGFNPPPAVYTPPSTGFNPPPAVYNPPSTGFNPPPAVYNPTATGFNPPPAVTNPPTTGFNPPPSVYTPPATGFNPPPAVYTPPATGFNPPPAVYKPPSTGFNPPPAVYNPSQTSQTTTQTTNFNQGQAYNPLTYPGSTPYNQPAQNPLYGQTQNQTNFSQNYSSNQGTYNYGQPSTGLPPFQPVPSTFNPIVQSILSNPDSLFRKYDLNNDGRLDYKEVYPSVKDAFDQMKVAAPSYDEVLKVMLVEDINKNGTLDQREYRSLLNTLYNKSSK